MGYATQPRPRSPMLMLSLSLTLCCGCGSRAVFILPGTPARIARPTPAMVWATDDRGAWILTRTVIPEGAVVGIPKQEQKK